MTAPASTDRPHRIDLLDVLRGLALLAMASYHTTWDFEFFGYLARGATNAGLLRLYARSIASTFLFLVGVSLVLAHTRGIRWRPFLRRLAQIDAGAAAVTIATYLTTPNGFVFFGILHQIAFASVVGLLFLRVPWPLTALCGLALILVAGRVSSPLFDTRWLAWTGFAETMPFSNDIVPVVPWTGVVLLGLAAGRLFGRVGLWPRLARLNAPLRHLRPLAWLGRHSLLFYLVHQPLLFGLVAGFAQLAPPDPLPRFRESCRATCLAERGAPFCERYCGCAEQSLAHAGLLQTLLRGTATEAETDTVRQTVLACSASSEGPP